MLWFDGFGEVSREALAARMAGRKVWRRVWRGWADLVL